MSDAIPAQAWAAIGGVAAAILTQLGNLVVSRRDAMRQDAQYWRDRAKDGDETNERLYARNQELHRQVETLIAAAGVVIQHATAVEEHASNVLGAPRTGDADAVPHG